MTTAFVSNIRGKQGPVGPMGPVNPSSAPADTAVGEWIATAGTSATKTALREYLSAKLGGLSVKDYGAVGDGVADDTVAIQACIDAAGATGLVVVPAGIYKVTGTLTLLASTNLQGSGAKSTELRNSVDVPTIKIVSGEGQSISGLMLRHSLVARTSFDIEITNPTKVVIAEVEISLSNATTGNGGIYMKADIALPGNAYMPQLDRVWIRNGYLKADGVTDGHVINCWFWGTGSAGDGSTGQGGTVNLVNQSNGWTFISNDVVAVRPTGAAYYIDATWHTNIIGGYCDGGPRGLHARNSKWIIMTGTWFHHMGRTGIRLENTNGCTFSDLMFDRCNQENNSYPDIYLTTSSYNSFSGTIHSQSVDNSNPGMIFNADSASVHNSIDDATVDLASGNYYPSPLFFGDLDALGKNNRPHVLWPRPLGVPTAIQPPPCAGLTAAAVAWPSAYMAIFHKFTLADAAAFRYANMYVEAAGGGSLQASVVKMNGLNWTRVCTSGAVVATAASTMSLDMLGSFLEAGEYALVIVSSSATLTTRLLIDNAMFATKQVAAVPSGAFLGTGGTLAGWSGTRAVTGLTLTA